MRDSSIKTSIEKAIGEEPWLTEEILHQMIRPHYKPNKEKRSLSKVLIPSVVTFAIALFAFILWNTETQPVQPEVAAFNYEAISNAIEDPQVENAFIIYLKSIENEDYASFEAVSTTDLVASPKEVFEKYQTIDLDTFRLISVTESQGEPVTFLVAAFAYKNAPNEVLKTYTVDQGDGTQMTVSEDFYGEYPDYTPFTFPETVTLNYEEIPTVQEISYHPDLIVDQASVGEEGTVSISAFQDGEFDVVFATDEKSYYLTRLSVLEVESLDVQPFMVQDTGETAYMLQAEGYGLIGALFMDERIHFVGTSPEVVSASQFDLDGDGTEEWLLDDEGVQVIRFEDGAFQSAILQSEIRRDPFPDSVFTYNLDVPRGDVFIETTLLEGEKRVKYHFNSTELLQKVQ